MPGSGAAQAVQADRVTFAQTSGHRPLKGQEPGVPVWALADRRHYS